MENLNEFNREIEILLGSEEKANQFHQHELSEQHGKRREQLNLFNRKAEQLMNDIVRPRLENVVRHFENATILASDFPHTQCVTRFDCRPRSPASATLSFKISHDTKIERICVEYTLRILPIFMKFEREDTISFPLSAINELQCENWVETKLLSFLKTYLQLSHIEQYQRQNLVVDPICGVQINKAFAIATNTPTGQKYYFCSHACREQFVLRDFK